MPDNSAHPTPLITDSLKAACANCNLRQLCVPGGIPSKQLEKLDALVAMRRKVKKGAALFNNGEGFQSLYAVRSGFFKTQITRHDGREQITGFQVPGELLGLDGVAADAHNVDAIAVENSVVCVLPYSDLERIARDFPPLQRQLHRVMSREIVRESGVMMLLGTMKAEERVVAFLLNLSERYKLLGYSSDEFKLRMTRAEIGSYLGLKLETVSRALTKIQDQGDIAIDGKSVQIINKKAASESINGQCV